jgi:hypothetical protein
MRRLRRRTIVIQVISLLVAVVLGCALLLAKIDADAAPKVPTAGSGSSPGVAAGAVSADAADAGADDAQTAIDLAIAPDGGVPFHPSGTTYRSPFAKPNPGPPLVVTVAMLLNSVDEYDVKTGLFGADFFLSLTSPTAMPTMNLQYPNGDVSSTEILADKPTFKLMRMKGKFKSPPDLRKYPFDGQQLKIFVEDDAHGIDQIRFVADRERAQLARGFRALGWSVTYVEARTFSHTYPDRFEGDDLYYGRYIFELGVQRYSTSAAFKVYVPAFVIVFIALLGMWVPAQEMEVRSNSGAPMLAGAVLFHFSLMQEVPATAYLTRADQLMLGVYACLMLGMISTWAMFVVREQNIERVFRIARVAVPVSNVLVMLAACLV